MADISPLKRELSQGHQEASIKKFKADSPQDSLSCEVFQAKLAQVISQLNEDREKDQIIIDEMKTRYEQLCTSQMDMLNDRLQAAYKGSEDPVNERIESLNQKFETISSLESDIDQFKTMLGRLHKDVTDDIAPSEIASD